VVCWPRSHNMSRVDVTGDHCTWSIFLDVRIERE